MRISDWSSDVCSSDLRQSEADGSKALDDLRRHVRVLAHHPILAALADTCCQRPGEPCGMSVASATGAAAILGPMEHRVELGDGDVIWAEDLGRADGTHLLLIMGANASGMTWPARSEERRVGAEWVSLGRTRGVPLQ